MLYDYNIKMNRQRPQRSYRFDHSPAREQLDLEDHNIRIKELIRSDLSMLQDENSLLKLKCKNIAELQEKVELVIKQNSHLLSENEKMSRHFHQQKSQNQMLRNKCESLSAQKYAMAEQFEQEKNKLINQLQRLNDQLRQVETLKQSQNNEIKSQYQTELQNLKRQLKNSESTSEQEIRKLRDQLERRENELLDIGSKCKRMNTQNDSEITRLKEDKEKLKNQLAYAKNDYMKEIQGLKFKLENNCKDQIQSLKKAHFHNLQELQSENARLTDGLEARGREIQQFGFKFNKQKIYYEDSINFLKRDNESYRQKMADIEKQSHIQINDLSQKLQEMHEAQIQEIQNKQQLQLQVFEQEIFRLENINNGKNIQLEQMIKDKAATRNVFDSQLTRVKEQYTTLLHKYKQFQFKHEDANRLTISRLTDKQKHIEYLEKTIQTQKDTAENGNREHLNVIQNLKQQLSNQKLMITEKESTLKNQLTTVMKQLEETRHIADQKQNRYQHQITTLKNEITTTHNQLNTKVQSLTAKNKIVERQNETLKTNLTSKQKQIKSLFQKIRASSQRQKKLQTGVDDLRISLVKKDKKFNQTFNQQNNKLKHNFQQATENLKSDYDTSLKMEINKNKNLQEKLKKKEEELNHLLELYKSMTEEIKNITEQEANKKDITLKYPGATANLLANKNMFDVYLKTKVFDVCGSLLKQNRPL